MQITSENKYLLSCTLDLGDGAQLLLEKIKITKLEMGAGYLMTLNALSALKSITKFSKKIDELVDYRHIIDESGEILNTLTESNVNILDICDRLTLEIKKNKRYFLVSALFIMHLSNKLVTITKVKILSHDMSVATEKREDYYFFLRSFTGKDIVYFGAEDADKNKDKRSALSKIRTTVRFVGYYMAWVYRFRNKIHAK
ncbi:hypothetical protein [Acidithiobacillus sp.]|uniref:hypothetical protein n=1 Tax=Acidithiobacillus sp. TaxID=1872118 RepID=UPI0026367F94|nr:hypothetical protein [Acidithiobacillus sp.]MDD5280445.1 hypothetical protein [Acidithiobacillus sp.]